DRPVSAVYSPGDTRYSTVDVSCGTVEARQQYRNCSSSVVAGWGCRKICTIAAPDLVAGCYGWSDAYERAHSRGNHGYSRRLPDRSHTCTFYSGSCRAIRSGHYRNHHDAAGRIQRTYATRPETRTGLFDN